MAKIIKGILLVIAIPIILILGTIYLIIRHYVEKYRASKHVCITCNGRFGTPDVGKYQCNRCLLPYNPLNS